MTIATVDIDHFKDFNDRHGQAAGDRALTRLARQIENVQREGDVLGRLDGDQFLLLLPGSDLQQTHELITRLRRALISDPVDIPDDGPGISVSVGTASRSGHNESIDRLIASAHAALYAEKRLRPEV